MATIRRSAEDIANKKKEDLEKKYTLIKQPNFTGTPEQLKMMQEAERAYRSGKPMMTDVEWDTLVKRYNYKESLDNVVAQGGRNYIKLSAPLVSLKKVYTETAVKEFMDKHPGKVVVEPKMDGCPLVLFYKRENDKMVLNKITSRGDGQNGLELYPCALWGTQVDGIPKEIDYRDDLPINSNGMLELRGELVVNKNDYPVNTVLRSKSAGIVNRKNPTIGEGAVAKGVTECCKYMITNRDDCINHDWPKKRNGDYAAYMTYYDENLNLFWQYDPKTKDWEPLKREYAFFVAFSIAEGDFNHDNIDLIKSLSNDIYHVSDIIGECFAITDDFKVVQECIRSYYGNRDDYGYEVDMTKRGRYKCPYPTDGLVIKEYDDSAEKQALSIIKNGEVQLRHDPKNAVAVKLCSRMDATKILEINYNTTNLGNTTITAMVEPFHAEDGKLVQKINLHNPEWLAQPENSYLKENAIIGIVQSGDIISVPMNLESMGLDPETEYIKTRERENS